MNFIKTTMVMCLAGLACAAPVSAQRNFDNVEITAQQLGEGIYVLFGAGGNIGVSIGEDGIILIDDQFAPLTDKIMAALAELGDGPIRFIINTHFHGDHTGGNENMGAAGAIIVAHDNVRARMSVDQFRKILNGPVAAAAKGAWPVVTFNDRVSLHLNGHDLKAMHVSHGHTDGDSIIHFIGENIIHMGDLFFNGFYPFIDVDMGGNVKGVIKAAEMVLADSDNETQIIPGHGSMAGKADLQAYHDMLQTISGRVRHMIDEGMTLDDIVAARPSADYDDNWGGNQNGINRFIGSVYYSFVKFEG